jgi:hypothetical protein
MNSCIPNTLKEFRAIGLATVVALSCCSCASPGAGGFDGKYVNQDTGGYIIFTKDGRFYYSFSNPQPPLAGDSLPRNMGHYYFRQLGDLTPVFKVRSAHVNQFEIRFSPTRERLYLRCSDLFQGERIYERTRDSKSRM